MQTDLISDDLNITEAYYERATAGKRLLNYIIDIILFYILVIVIGVLFIIVAPETTTGLLESNDLLSRLVSLLLYAIYMSVIEGLFKGKSLGKLITRTRAVNMDGSRISISTAFARGFSRAVPFCVFSAFGNPCNPWQDKWTDTMVIDEKLSQQ